MNYIMLGKVAEFILKVFLIDAYVATLRGLSFAVRANVLPNSFLELTKFINRNSYWTHWLLGLAIILPLLYLHYNTPLIVLVTFVATLVFDYIVRRFSVGKF